MIVPSWPEGRGELLFEADLALAEGRTYETARSCWSGFGVSRGMAPRGAVFATWNEGP